MASKKVSYVLQGYLKLSTQEKLDFIAEIQKINEKLEKGLLTEEFSESIKRAIGPISSGVCTCCGR